MKNAQPQDSRWQQRFNNYLRALRNLSEAVELTTQRKLSNLEQQGLIQAFEYTSELAWNVLKDYLTEAGIPDINFPKEAVREAYNKGLISKGEDWMAMLEARNKSSHSYNEELADSISRDIIHIFYPLFQDLATTLTKKWEAER